jgi:hypothetical protein
LSENQFYRSENTDYNAESVNYADDCFSKNHAENGNPPDNEHGITERGAYGGIKSIRAESRGKTGNICDITDDRINVGIKNVHAKLHDKTVVNDCIRTYRGGLPDQNDFEEYADSDDGPYADDAAYLEYKLSACTSVRELDGVWLDNRRSLDRDDYARLSDLYRRLRDEL